MGILTSSEVLWAKNLNIKALRSYCFRPPTCLLRNRSYFSKNSLKRGREALNRWTTFFLLESEFRSPHCNIVNNWHVWGDLVHIAQQSMSKCRGEYYQCLIATFQVLYALVDATFHI